MAFEGIKQYTNTDSYWAINSFISYRNSRNENHLSETNGNAISNICVNIAIEINSNHYLVNKQ